MSYSRTVAKARSQKAASGLAALRRFVKQGNMSTLRFGLEDADKMDEDSIVELDDTVTKVREELTESVPNETETIIVNGEETETSAEPTDSQVDAAIDVMRMANDSDGVALEAYRSGSFNIPTGYEVIGHNGPQVMGERSIGNEQFIEQELTNATEISLFFNVRGQRQSRMAELFFRTTVLPVEAPYAKFELYAPQIVQNRRRQIDKVSAHTYTRLLDAAIDATLLNKNATQAIPVSENKTSAFFYEPDTTTGLGYEVTLDDGDTFDTAPLALGEQVNLINLSSRPGLVDSGILDNTDTLEASIRLLSLYGKFDNTDYVKFDVSNLPSMQFISSDNSVGDEVQFSHTGRFAVVNSDTLAVDGVTKPFASLAPTYSGDVILSIGVSGNFNLNTGIGHVSATGGVKVAGYIKPGATEVSMVEVSALQTIFDDLEIGGYDTFARRTNANRRHEGRLLSALPVKEAWRIEVSEPLLAQLPAGVNDQKAQEIASQILIAGSRLRNTNLAFDKLFSTAAAMKGMASLNALCDVGIESEGIARYLIRPQFLYKKVDFDDGMVVSSLKSHERAADISACITNEIRLMSTQLWVGSNLESAFQFAADQGNIVKPKLAIGTDPIISQHLIVTGDTRLVGIRFNYECAFDMDSRMKDKIFLAFVSEDHQYLTFGQHLWVAEIVSNLPISRDGRTVRELQVQPRNRHIITMPVLGQIDCVNLDKALTNPDLPTIPFEQV